MATTPATFHFYSTLFTTLDASLQTYVNDIAAGIINAITPVAHTLLLIYVMLWGWSMMRGMIGEPIMDGATRIVRLSIIVGLALNLGRYNSYVADFLWNTPDALSQIIASGYSDSNTKVQYLDTLMGQMYTFGNRFYDKALESSSYGIPDLGYMFFAAAIWLCGVLATGFGAFLLALSKMMLAILLAVGPIFILLTVFEPTKKLFDSWFGQCLTFVFTAVLTSAAIKLIFTILETYLGKGNAMVDISPNVAIPAIVFAIIGVLTLRQVPSLASALGGGIGISTLGAVSNLYGKALKGTGAVKNEVSGKAASDRTAAKRARVTNKKWAERANAAGRAESGGRAENAGRATGRATAAAAAGVATAATAAAGAPMAVYRKVASMRKNRISQG